MYRGKVVKVDTKGVYVLLADFGVIGPCQAVVANYAVGDMVLLSDVGTDAMPDLVVVGSLGNGGRWQQYTPTLTASTTNPTNWNRAGRYVRSDGLIVAQFSLTASGTMTPGSGEYYLSPPVPMNTSQSFRMLGTVRMRDSSAGVNAIGVCQQDGSNDRIRFELTAGWPTGSSLVVWSGGPWTWGANDTLYGIATYEPA